MPGLATQEIEVVTMQQMLDNGHVYDLNERRQLKEAIENRKHELVAGLDHPTARHWTQKLQAEVEPLLRMRFCPRSGFVIDRWVEDLQCWHQIPGTCGFDGPRAGLCERMRSQYDLWKQVTPKENEDAMAGRAEHPLHKQAEEKSSAIRAENERQAAEKVLGAVDSLSSKRIKEFIEVERAIQTGDTVWMHGETRKSFDRLTDAGKKAVAEFGPEPDSVCANPRAHPLTHKHLKE